MDRLAQRIDEDENDATAAVASHQKSEERGPDAPSGQNKVVIDVDLPESIGFDLLDEELQKFLDQIIVTGIVIY